MKIPRLSVGDHITALMITLYVIGASSTLWFVISYVLDLMFQWGTIPIRIELVLIFIFLQIHFIVTGLLLDKDLDSDE